MQVKQLLGHTSKGERLYGYRDGDTRFYHLNDKLVAIAVDEPIDRAMYYCLEGIWHPQDDTTIVTGERLQQMAEGC